MVQFGKSKDVINMESKISITKSNFYHKLEIKDDTNNNYILILDNELKEVYNILGKYIDKIK